MNTTKLSFILAIAAALVGTGVASVAPTATFRADVRESAGAFVATGWRAPSE